MKTQIGHRGTQGNCFQPLWLSFSTFHLHKTLSWPAQGPWCRTCGDGSKLWRCLCFHPCCEVGWQPKMGEKGKDKMCQCCYFTRKSKSHWLKQDGHRTQWQRGKRRHLCVGVGKIKGFESRLWWHAEAPEWTFMVTVLSNRASFLSWIIRADKWNSRMSQQCPQPFQRLSWWCVLAHISFQIVTLWSRDCFSVQRLTWQIWVQPQTLLQFKNHSSPNRPGAWDSGSWHRVLWCL